MPGASGVLREGAAGEAELSAATGTPALIAGPGDHAVLVAPLGSPEDALAAGVQAAGRPLVIDVSDPGTPADAIMAALDVGAAGALVHTGDVDADAALIGRVRALEERRLDEAPPFSVIVCSYNASAYLDRCLESLAAVRYPRYEVIVVDDGSRDGSVGIARRHGVRVVELEHGGLAAARNAGVAAASGEVVLFVDADAAAEPELLSRLWRLLDRLGSDGAGGPNLPFPDAGWQERAVAGAPGAPIPVVHPDGSALHLPGCNMAFRRDAIAAIGGFDARFPGAGDDVDFCLRLRQAGRRLTLHPGAAVLHHRRDTVAGFLRQQYSYGAGTPKYEEVHSERGAIPTPRRSLAARLDPRRERPVFAGPQARQLYTIAERPLHFDLPLKLAVLIAVSALATAPLAARRRRIGAWAATFGLAEAALFGFVAARVPARGPVVRVTAAALWFAQPAARRLGESRARRAASKV